MKFASGFILASVAIAIAGSSAESTNMLTFDPASLPKYNQPIEEGPGPEIFPDTPAPSSGSSSATSSIAFSGSASSSGAASSCNQVCPDDYSPVCGTDGFTYSNSCELGIASCQNPAKGVAKKSDGPCSP